MLNKIFSYPQGSVNPQGSIEGGMGLYANPVPRLDSATQVMLQYQVFFPVGFNFVKGGKLPGIYGGRTGCSGGSDAKDCFSTRNMV